MTTRIELHLNGVNNVEVARFPSMRYGKQFATVTIRRPAMTGSEGQYIGAALATLFLDVESLPTLDLLAQGLQEAREFFVAGSDPPPTHQPSPDPAVVRV